MNELVSLVTTVKNEGTSIDAFLTSLRNQTRRPDEIVIVDGGSTDETVDRLERAAAREPSMRLLSAHGSTIADGRNAGIRVARGSIIAVTDAGTELARDWLELLVRPLEEDRELAVSSGFYLAGGRTWFERRLATIITPQLVEIDPASFLPSSRSAAFRKEWWARVGGYPEWLRHCEDLVFNLELRDAGARFAFTPEALVTWNSRSNMAGFFRQYFYYARGDAHAHLYADRHAVRYLAYASGVGLASLGRRSWTARSLLAVGMAAHFAPYLRRVRRRPVSESRVGQFTALAVTPVIVVTGDVAKILGYAVGRRERSAVQRSRRAAAGQVDR